MKKNIKIGAMSLLLVLLPGSLGVGTVYSSSGGNPNVNEENTTYRDNNRFNFTTFFIYKSWK